MILENVSYSYKNEKNIINNINYEFVGNKHYLIQGDNGSGKTTLIRLLLGFIKPSSGRIVIDDDIVFSYCPDHNGVYNDLSVIDNIIFRLAIYKMDYDKCKIKIDNLLEKYNLLDSKNKTVNELSQGMKKKLAIICAVVVDFDILIMDEPTNGVDEKSKKEIIKMLNDISDTDKSIICITHDKDLINSFKGIPLKIEGGKLYESI